jgi:hypothetical protein
MYPGNVVYGYSESVDHVALHVDMVVLATIMLQYINCSRYFEFSLGPWQD